jgi:hypothetical protein
VLCRSAIVVLILAGTAMALMTFPGARQVGASLLALILGTVFLHLDFAMPLEPLRAELQRVVENAPEWDGRVCGLQVTDSSERTMQARILVSAASAGQAFDLRCHVREQLIAFVAREYPQFLPRLRGLDPEPSGA